MRILIECFWYKEAGPYFTYGVLSGLMHNGIEVYAITTDLMENKVLWDSVLDSEHVYYWHGLPQKNKPFSYVKNLIAIKKKFDSIIFDYVLITFPGRSDLVIRHFLSYRQNIMILHDVVPHSSTSNKTTKYMYRTVAKADNILVLTKSYRQIIKRLFHKADGNILYMRLGMVLYPRTSEKRDDRLTDSVNFLYFGRIDGYKGLHILAEAYEKVQGDSVSLRIVGNGNFEDYRAEYEQLQNVQIVNRYIEDTEVESFFTVPNTVLILPYLDATQSGIISMAYDFITPVIVTDVGGLKEQLFDGEVGVICPPNDPEKLSEAMRRFIIDPCEYKKQHDKMHAFRGKMHWDCVVKELLEQLERR